MAQQIIQLDREKLSCSICLDLLKDPVTIPCGHSYCLGCIKNYWDEEKKAHSCPQCRQSFTPRPVLVKSTILVELVDELKKAELQDPSPGHSYDGPGDVACDFCTGGNLKAIMSCLICMASYCELHLQPHYNIAPLKKHKLIKATSKLQDNICSRHDEVMKIFCRTDQKCICYLCSLDEHKGHDTVSAATERAERQTELEVSRQKIQQRFHDREKDVKVLQQEVEAINLSADKVVKESQKFFKDLISLIEIQSSEVKQKIRSQQEAEVSRAEELQKKMQQEITELKRKDAELEQLSSTEDHLHFLNSYPSLSHLSDSTDLPRTHHTLRYFEEVAAAVSEARDTLQKALSEECWKISGAVKHVEVLLSQGEPDTREEFQKYYSEITLDPNTVNTRLLLNDTNRKATLGLKEQFYPSHSDRFVERWQVLSVTGLSGRCYWEMKWSGKVIVAVAYKDISRAGTRDECGLGLNDKSWALTCSTTGYEFRHNNISTSISGPKSCRIGVYLDHRAGILSFYSISDTMTLLHKVQTRFTQPLYPGFWIPYNPGDTVELCDLK
ncbi:E3 ubiquitin/ISG15 ligase TRIM25-like [Melanotaenia boesemani]|uniref:E3 ubiquitin/ISG15 ligase TRIM25-like n=1 Tax=Melanotaenia boesemani TaxID=1250792 RepID=UPI001C058817|nr:E3 ubiquitin/ISG15 ligase TRIM25-like [Melanotaenia boesemani]